MNTLTPQVQKLYNALQKRGIKCEIEEFDGYKHVDISIPWAKIDIEVDGLRHFTDAKQIITDFERSYWSLERDDYDTIHIPNLIIDQHLDAVADALAEAARIQYKSIQENERNILHRIKDFFFKK